MKEEERLIKLNLQKEQQKQNLTRPEGIKLYFFRTLYSILKNRSLNYFCDILFTIFEFIQLISFPMSKTNFCSLENPVKLFISSRYFLKLIFN